MNSTITKLLSGILLLFFVCFPNEVKEGALAGLNNGLFILIPSLFPYMAISQIFIKTGGADSIAALLYKPLNFLTRLSQTGASIYILSLFCGYPTGARLSSIAFDDEEIGKNETIKLFAAGNIPGFGFCAAFLGGAIFKESGAGLLAYLSFVLASFILIITLSKIFPNDKTISRKRKNPRCGFGTAAVQSVTESSASAVMVIAFVCFFSAIIKITGLFCKNTLLSGVIASFTEITMGLSTFQMPRPIVIFFTGFSGLSIIFQSLAFQKKKAVNIFLFIILRLIYGILAALIFFILS
jgi:hypothetical protein